LVTLKVRVPAGASAVLNAQAVSSIRTSIGPLRAEEPLLTGAGPAQPETVATAVSRVAIVQQRKLCSSSTRATDW
jgi:hypothetical protein